jgi:hypothetical protein
MFWIWAILISFECFKMNSIKEIMKMLRDKGRFAS